MGRMLLHPRMETRGCCNSPCRAEQGIELTLSCTDIRSEARKIASRYEGAVDRRAVIELSVTVAGLAASLWGVRHALDASAWPLLAFILPGAGFLVRLFIIQHDCAHHSFFCSAEANRW